MIPLTLVYDEWRYATLEVLQRPGVEKACGHLAYFYFANYGVIKYLVTS